MKECSTVSFNRKRHRMTWLDWLIVIVPVALLIWISVYSRKYARGVVDFLAAGRVA